MGRVAAVIFLTTALTCCSTEDALAAVRGSTFSTEEYSRTVNDFAQNMMSELWTTEGANFAFSPFGLHVALAMMTSASTDNSVTQRELLDALGRFRNIEGLEANYAALTEEYETLNQLAFGNRLWTAEEILPRVDGRFLEKLDAVYRADVEAFSDRSQVDRWVSDVTRGKINDMGGGDRPSADVVVMITTAIYFRSAWKVGFNPVPVGDADSRFSLADGRRVAVGMMSRTSVDFAVTSDFDFANLPGFRFKAVAVPYEGDRFEMIVVVPTTTGNPRGIDFLLDSMTSDRGGGTNVFDRIGSEIASAKRIEFRRETRLILPRFTIESDLDAIRPLRNLGVEAAFDAAQFDKIASDLTVSDVRHRCAVEVTLDGTVGAAATGIDVVPLIGSFETPALVKVDKPFLFVVHDNLRKTLLFAGKVGDPTTSSS